MSFDPNRPVTPELGPAPQERASFAPQPVVPSGKRRSSRNATGERKAQGTKAATQTRTQESENGGAARGGRNAYRAEFSTPTADQISSNIPTRG